MQTASIVTSADHNFVTPTMAMLRSLSVSIELSQCAADVYVLESGLSDANKNLIASAVPPSRLQLRFVSLNIDRIRHLKLSGHVSIATYYRLLVERELSHLKRLIYLDADTIVLGAISDLWHHPLDGAHLWAVPQVWRPSAFAGGERGLPSFRLLGIPAESPMFNAGVMLIDLERRRLDNVSERVIEYLTDYSDHVLWWDQDGLNAILCSDWRPLPLRWNVMASHVPHIRSQEDTPFPFDLVQDAIRSPAIVHFSSSGKPWESGYNGPFKQEFDRFDPRTHLSPGPAIAPSASA